MARWVSILLHPFLVLASVGLLATAQLSPWQLPRMLSGLVVAIVGVGGWILWRWKRGDWTTVDASDRRERPGLYRLLLLVGAVLAIWLGGAGTPGGRGVVFVLAMLTVAALANRWIKLSLHMASLAFAVPVLWGVWPLAGVVALALLSVLGWSRLAMRRHRLCEVLGGALLGVLAGLALSLS